MLSGQRIPEAEHLMVNSQKAEIFFFFLNLHIPTTAWTLSLGVHTQWWTGSSLRNSLCVWERNPSLFLCPWGIVTWNMKNLAEQEGSGDPEAFPIWTEFSGSPGPRQPTTEVNSVCHFCPMLFDITTLEVNLHNFCYSQILSMLFPWFSQCLIQNSSREHMA